MMDVILLCLALIFFGVCFGMIMFFDALSRSES